MTWSYIKAKDTDEAVEIGKYLVEVEGYEWHSSIRNWARHDINEKGIRLKYNSDYLYFDLDETRKVLNSMRRFHPGYAEGIDMWFQPKRYSKIKLKGVIL